MRWGALLAVPVAAVLLLTACSIPEGDPAAYREEAVSTLQAAHSEVESARITVWLRLDDRTFSRAADTSVTGSETALTSIAGTFSGLQPPPGADAVRDRATQLLSDAQDAVEAARIAVRRDDRQGLRQALSDLAKSSTALHAAAGALS